MESDIVSRIARALGLPPEAVAKHVTSPDSLAGCLGYPDVERALDATKPARRPASHTVGLIRACDERPRS